MLLNKPRKEKKEVRRKRASEKKEKI